MASTATRSSRRVSGSSSSRKTSYRPFGNLAVYLCGSRRRLRDTRDETNTYQQNGGESNHNGNSISNNNINTSYSKIIDSKVNTIFQGFTGNPCMEAGRKLKHR